LASRRYRITHLCIFLGECPRHEAASINFWTVRHSATVFCDSTEGRGAAFITNIIVVDGNIDNDGIIEDNGEFVQFSFLFLEFPLENLIFQSIWTPQLAK
jgi:hypothetical protein